MPPGLKGMHYRAGVATVPVTWRPWLSVSLLGWAACLPGASLAQTHDELRCGGRIIDPGAALGSVLDRCGTPLERSARDVPIRVVNANGTTRVIGTSRVERLVYDRGWGRFPAALEFEDGVLRRIEYLPERGGVAR
jgi:hypothetical protein